MLRRRAIGHESPGRFRYVSTSWPSRMVSPAWASADRLNIARVMEIAGSQQSLAKAEDAKQRGNSRRVRAIPEFPHVSVPARCTGPSCRPRLVHHASRRACSVAAAALVAIARDHAAFVQGLTRQRTLLERRIYVVVPWSARRVRRCDGALPCGACCVGDTAEPTIDDDQPFRDATISRQLTDRCDAISRQLGRAGLRTSRLDDLGLAQLYHASWAPEIARTQRLRRELGDYTSLVVGSDNRSPRYIATGAYGNPPNLEGRSLRSHVPGEVS